MSELFPKYTLRSPKDGPKGLIIAGIHGDEYEPILAVMQLLQTLKSRLLRGCLTLVPVANKSAYLAGRRVGEDGLDLARTCPGNQAGSITEAVAYQLSNQIRESDFLIDMHTGGTLFDIFPLSGYMIHSNPRVLEMQRSMAAAFNLPVIWGTSPDLQGRTLSIARDAEIPAIYTEFRGGGFRPEGIGRLVAGCEHVLSYFEMLGEEERSANISLKIEDKEPGSGQLQRMYPAPGAGVFVPQVGLGAEVRRYDPIGEIWDYSGKVTNQVLAEKDGTVFLLRAIPRVEKGEALAGILPNSKVTSNGRD
ncbi:succinylglutamate desuccinylase/aspartoacylase family protein [Cyclobacterium xiamenense]|uniref:succinylglutamate desuccinylase/aspartoacylase family protein n=1 Tax=Cyclobacterium xiamenense TaxID=1297121 RepID=UPI0035D122B8